MRFVLFLIGTFLLATISVAQVTQGGKPIQAIKLKSNGVPVIEMPKVDNIQLKKAALQQNSDLRLKPYRFAHPFDVKISTENEGIWLPAINGFKIWQVKIHSENAKSINLIFDKFELPEGARLFIFNEEKSHVLGAYTSVNNKPSRKFAVSPVAGDEITVQYEVPETQTNTNNFIISRVNHAFDEILKYDERRPLNKTAGSCNLDINCDLGDEWNDVKDAVCRIIVHGVEICTGTLVNNTKEDETPYIISASHCYDEWDYAETSVYTFNYESPYCAPLDGDPSHSVSGAIMKAKFDSLDFALTELSLVPPPEFHPYFAGWNRQNVAPNSSTTIHHPQGDIKKLSIDDDASEFASFNSDYIPNSFIKIQRWEIGATEAGSSGGPLFNSKKQLIGTLTGGAASCSNPVRDYFSRFSQAWDFKNDSTKQLKYWLDPLNLGIPEINGNRFFDDENYCDSYTNLDDIDKHENVPLTTFGEFSGYWGGTNNVGITEFMERFYVPDSREISAVSFGIGKLSVHSVSENSEIMLKIYNGTDLPETLIHYEKIELNDLAKDAMNRIELSKIVRPDNTFFVGFELSDVNPLDSVVLYQSLRSGARVNNFFFKQDGQWQNFKTANIDNNSMTNVIELLACNISESTTDTPLVNNPLEILIYPNPTNSYFTFEAGKNITLEDIKVYNIMGQEVQAYFSDMHERKVNIHLNGNRPGVYVVQFNTGEGFVSEKLSFVP